MAMVELMKRDLLKFIISQNIDGLHRKSGIPAEKISEAHGNTNLEICEKCNKDYMRDYGVKSNISSNKHKTGRKCDNPKCKGDLYDSIINFGEGLKPEVITKANEMGEESDLMLCMGTSLRVQPVCNIPMMCGINGD